MTDKRFGKNSHTQEMRIKELEAQLKEIEKAIDGWKHRAEYAEDWAKKLEAQLKASEVENRDLKIQLASAKIGDNLDDVLKRGQLLSDRRNLIDFINMLNGENLSDEDLMAIVNKEQSENEYQSY